MLRLNQKLDPTRTGVDAEELHAELKKNIVGQNEAIAQVVNVYQTFLSGMNSPGRPVGSFLFLGPTGSGKTRLVEATAAYLAGDDASMIKIDCAEFQHSHEIAKLIGSPPGYLGHRETHPVLSPEALNPHSSDKRRLSFVLFDEIEKASDALWNLLLGILDRATLTLGDNRRVDFSRTLIFMTSNLGATEMEALRSPRFGFGASPVTTPDQAIEEDQESAAKTSRIGVEAARRKFTPEFMNRIDRMVVFKPLGHTELRRILGIELGRLQQRILSSPSGAPFVIALTEAAKDRLLCEGTDARYGARHLKRALDRSLVHPLSNLIASNQVREGDWLTVDFDPETYQMTFTKEAENLPAYTMLQMAEAPVLPSVALAAAMNAGAPDTAVQTYEAPGRRKERNLAA